MAKSDTEVEYNWLPIALIVGAIFLFQQKGCEFDLGNILPKSTISAKLNVNEPSSEYKNAELTAFQTEVAKNPKKAAACAAFYFAFSDIISRNPTFFQTKQQFRQQHSEALKLAFKDDPALKDPELGTEIEAYLQKFISLEPTPLELDKTKNCLLALSWAAQQ